jgi:hypothetical protein
MIPKPDGGGERALGIPTIRDRVAQTAAKLVLEPIFEADFEDNAAALWEPAAAVSSLLRPKWPVSGQQRKERSIKGGDRRWYNRRRRAA